MHKIGRLAENGASHTSARVLSFQFGRSRRLRGFIQPSEFPSVSKSKRIVRDAFVLCLLIFVSFSIVYRFFISTLIPLHIYVPLPSLILIACNNPNCIIPHFCLHFTSTSPVLIHSQHFPLEYSPCMVSTFT